MIYNFYQKDHLGNICLVSSETAPLHQRTLYYPFGLPIPESLNPERQPYKFGGKEFDEMHGMNASDFSARIYFEDLGRFMTPDPLAEKYYSISPYVYCANNPLRFIDPNGMEIMLPGEKEAQDAYVQMLYTSTGNRYSIVDNKLTFVDVDANFEGTKSQTLINTIQSGINSKDVYTLNLVGANGDDKGVFIDSYVDAKIDVSDLKVFGKASTALQAAAIGHFLYEIQAEAGYNTASPEARDAIFMNAHNPSLGIEGRIYGELVGDGTITTREDTPTGEITNKYQTFIRQFNLNNRFEIRQKVIPKTTTSNEYNGIKFPFPVTTTITVPTGELKSVKKLP